MLETALKLHAEDSNGEEKGAAVTEEKTPDDSVDREKALTRAERLVPRDKRPTHRLPIGPLPFGLPLIGKKVDSIDWARQEIEETTTALEKGRNILRKEEKEVVDGVRGKVHGFAGLVGGLDAAVPLKSGLLHKKDDDIDSELVGPTGRASTSTRKRGNEKVSGESSGEPDSEPQGSQSKVRLASEDEETYPPLNSAFVLFNQQIAAHMAAQSLTHHEPYRMSAKYVEVAPADVIWGNLGLNPYEMKVRLAISYGVTIGLIIVWAIPGELLSPTPIW